MKLYACAVDWQHEIKECSDLNGKVPLYYTIKDLKKNRNCWKQCGIVEIELNLKRWVKKQNLFKR